MADQKDYVQNKYAPYQDVHVMVFIGFGFLMTFIKTGSLQALSYNWIVSVWCIQWGILSNGFWHQIVVTSDKPMHKLTVALENMIVGDFGAGTAMITFGAVLGKANLQQLIVLTTWEMIFWGLNESIGIKMGATDMGGSMFVHTFGAYYGVAATWFFRPNAAKKSLNCQESYYSDITAMIGSIFLWMYWPSFNGALGEGATQHRTMINTVLAISGSVIGTVCVSRCCHHGKLNMELILNATLAGGVAIGSSADIVTAPWAAMLIGYLGGVLSSVGFEMIGPFLSEKINLQDTCGVHSLHGMPGVFAAIVSAICISIIGSEDFPSGYWSNTDSEGNVGAQVSCQILTLVITLGIAILSGLTGGWLATRQCLSPDSFQLFRDDDHVAEVFEKYPADFMGDGYDCVYEHGSKEDVRNAIVKLRLRFFPDNEDDGLSRVFNAVWDDKWSAKDNLSAFVRKADPSVVMSQSAFDSICEDMGDQSGKDLMLTHLMGGQSGRDLMLSHLKQWTIHDKNQ